jgi:hypothetical protein
MSAISLMRQEVTIETVQANVRSKTGDSLFETGYATRARFQRTTKTIMGPDRKLQPVDGIVFLPPNIDIAVGSRMTYDGQAYRVLRLDEPPGGNGRVDHLEAMVQSWSYAA